MQAAGFSRPLNRDRTVNNLRPLHARCILNRSNPPRTEMASHLRAAYRLKVLNNTRLKMRAGYRGRRMCLTMHIVIVIAVSV
jgi:hypothetical protein